MAEYIDREAFINHLQKDPLFELVERYGITHVIESFPAADVVPSDELTGDAKDLIRYMPYAVNMLAENLMEKLTDVILYGSPETEAKE